jgi:hypothetical protein
MATPVYNIDSPYETDLYNYNGYDYIYNGVFTYEESGVEYGGDVSESSQSSTLSQELNRLANGGTYRDPAQMVGMALAARQWAAQRSITTNLTNTVGVLNAIDGRTNSNTFLDFNGVCNDLASTTGLPAAQALRAISS